LLELPDPRRFAAATPASPQAAAVHRDAAERLAASASAAADALDLRIDAALETWARAGDGASLAAALAGAPAVDVCRHLWRRLAIVEPRVLATPDLACVLFAIPVVIVAAQTGPGEPAVLPGTLADTAAIGDLLRAHDAVAPDARVTLSPAFVPAESLAIEALPALWRPARDMLHGAGAMPLALMPAPLTIAGTQEAAHLRYIVGFGVHAPQAELLRAAPSRTLGGALMRVLSGALAAPGSTALALPGAPQRLVAASAAGRAAQRQVALELFLGNALRKLRARYGEPTAVLSAHIARDAPGGGELRLALSSVFAPRESEGFRYPLQPQERVPDAIQAIVTLLADCRVADVRAVAGVQPDCDAATGLLRFGRPDEAPGTVH